MTIAITFYREHGRDEIWYNQDLYAQSERNDILIRHVDLARELKVISDKNRFTRLCTNCCIEGYAYNYEICSAILYSYRLLQGKRGLISHCQGFQINECGKAHIHANVLALTRLTLNEN